MRQLRRNGSQVELEVDGMLVRFHPHYGAVPLEIYKLTPTPILVSDPHAGAGASTAWNTGQDATQASHNGIDPFPIATFPDPASWPRSYYAYELLFDTINLKYKVQGFAPMFWISHEAIDDTIPTDSRGPSGWSTLYNDFLNLGASSYTAFGTPIYFSPRNAVNSGIIFPGNEIENLKTTLKPWAQRLMQIPRGRFAGKCRISLAEASSDAIAGILLRCEVPSNATDINAAYNSVGCKLLFNKFGGCELVRQGYGSVWTYPKPWALAPALNSGSGLEVEIRSHNWDPYAFSIYLKGELAVEAREPYLGPHFGLFAQCSAGKIGFGNRIWVDVGAQFTNTYRGTGRHTLEILSEVNRIAEPFDAPVYRAHTPAIFLNPAIPVQRPHSLQLWHKNGNWYSWDNLDALYPNHHGLYRGMLPASDVRGIWLGKNDSSVGLFGIPREVPSNGYFIHQTHAVGVSPLSEDCEQVPGSYPFRTMTEWYPTVRTDILPPPA